MIRRIDRVEAKTGRCRPAHIRGRFEVIGIGAGRFAPIRFRHPAERVVHYLLRTPSGAGHFADRLLRVHRRNPRTGPPHRLHMARSCQADAVAKTKTWRKAQTNRFGDRVRHKRILRQWFTMGNVL